MFNRHANTELVQKIQNNGNAVLVALLNDLEDILEGGREDLAARLYFTGSTHISATHVWYEMAWYHAKPGEYTIFATIEGNGECVAVLDETEFEDYEA